MSRSASIGWTTPFPEERDVSLNFDWRPGSPSSWEPGDPPEVEITLVLDSKTDAAVTLTPEQEEKALDFIFEKFDFDPGDDDE